jgi:hypothetical protein
VHLIDTRWFSEVKLFLESSPNSSLFAVVQEVVPEFQAVPPDTRAHLWFWMKKELHSLAANGVLVETVEDDHTTTWSMCKSGAAPADGIRKR